MGKTNKESAPNKENLALQAEVDRLEKLHGVGSVMDGNTIIDVEKCSSGSISLDRALGGGYGLGRIVEIYGPESSGKTTLTLEAAVQAQKKYPNKWIAIVDAEHSFDPEYAEKLGLNMDMVKISQPDNGEQAIDIAIGLIGTGAFSMCIIDSVAALTPKAELEGEMTDSQMGLHARLMSKALRKMTGVANNTNTMVFFINQLRDKIGVMFGNPETTTGGNALKFYATQRIDIRRSAGDKDGDEFINNKTKCKIVKNKIAPPFKKCEFNIGFGTGIDKTKEVVDLAVDFGIINKAGSWYSYGETKLGQGTQGVLTMVKDNPEFEEELRIKIFEAFSVIDSQKISQ